MSLSNQNISIKLRGIQLMSWEASEVEVAPRPYHALVLRLRGRASFFCGDMSSDTAEGDIFFMPANHSYRASYPEQNEVLAIHFESDLSACMENFRLNNPARTQRLFEQMHEVWEKKESGCYYTALSLMCEILGSITSQMSPAISRESLRSFENALAYMEKNFTDSLFSVKDMVLRSYMSNTYFSRLFYTRFNTTPIKYLTAKRLSYAEKLLMDGKYSVKEVSEMSGFSDVKYFSRVVKKEYGVPPSKLYRHTSKIKR